ncbi:MAG: redoxin domain-containing protein [Thermoanaerobaculia bacterium]|nr:redoxin domain-containing protein [Thermoanaerobaculia bacterium]
MINVGDIAPDFSLPAILVEPLPSPDDGDTGAVTGRTVTLTQYRGSIDVLVMFYPLDWSPVCSSEHMKCAKMFPTYSNRLQVLGISVDSVWSHSAFAKAHQIRYPLLSDFQPRGAVAQQYGAYLPDFGFAARTAFLVDKRGRVKLVLHAEVPEERELEAVLRNE